MKTPAKVALINFNDETGKDIYSVELEEDVGNWLDSFEFLWQAIHYIAHNGLQYDFNGFRDTRSKHWKD